MPSQKVLEQKKQQVLDLTEKLNTACTGVIVDYKGINVEDDTKLRKELREAGVEYFVVKNSILGFACDNVGLSDIKEVLHGTTAIAISADDYTAAARILDKFAKGKENFSIKKGFIDGEIVGEDEIKKLANLPSRDGLLSMLLSALTGNLRGLACAINGIVEQQGGAPADSAEA